MGNVPLVGISAAREMQKCSHGQGWIKEFFFAPTEAQEILMNNSRRQGTLPGTRTFSSVKTKITLIFVFFVFL